MDSYSTLVITWKCCYKAQNKVLGNEWNFGLEPDVFQKLKLTNTPSYFLED